MTFLDRCAPRAQRRGAWILALAWITCACANDRGTRVAEQTPAKPSEPFTERSPATHVDRVTTAVPWPRGIAWHDGKLLVLARGVHRSAGGPNPDIPDQAGTLFSVDPTVFEPAVGRAGVVGEAVRANAVVVAAPTRPPFYLWDRRMPSTTDTRTDRPYCTLVFDAASRNAIICGYSGIDLPKPAGFRKNATDSVLRYDMRDKRWHVIDQHDPDVVPDAALKKVVAPHYYPHHDPRKNPPPHGFVNGACGAAIAGDCLYVGAKDNTALVQYDMRDIRRQAAAPPPQGRYAFRRADWKSDVFVELEGLGQTYVEGTCALAVHDRWLYVAFRTTSQIVRFPLQPNGDLERPLVGQLVALFKPYDAKKGGGSANIYDMTFGHDGLLYVSPGYDGAIYRFRPDPSHVYDARATYPTPYVDLKALVGAKKSGNICFDPDGNLYICSGQKVLADGEIHGVVYRVAPTAAPVVSAAE